jgi:hypothetical protein
MKINQESFKKKKKKNLIPIFPIFFGPKNDKMCRVRPKCSKNN